MTLAEIKERIERLQKWSRVMQEELRYIVDALSSAPAPFHFQSPEAEGVEEAVYSAPVAARKVKYEFKGLDCPVHGQAPHKRERHTLGPWICDECHSTKTQPRDQHADHQASD